MGKTLKELRAERRRAVREIRREQRTLERIVNVMERHLRRALSKSRLIDWKDAERLLEDWKSIQMQFETTYRKLKAFVELVGR